MSRLKRYSVVVTLILAAVFAFSGIAQARNEGQIVYVEGIIRGTDGEVTGTTGDMKVQNIATGVTRTVVTNVAAPNGPLVMLNPAFTADGKKILFTAGNAGTNYKVYLVSSQAGTALATATALKAAENYNLRYATLSPDSDGATTGLLAYTRDTGPTTSTHELWVYNFATKKSTLLVQAETGRQLKHPVFLSDNDTIAYVGVKSGIQNIYTVKASTGLITAVTTNKSPTPRYGRLVSNVNKSVGAADALIYAKQVYETLNYGRFDIYVCDLASGIETPVTATTLLDEFEPAFYGDDTTTPALGDTTGDMFYSANITGAISSVWQTNFDATDITQSNGAKFERTNVASGLANWGVSPTFAEGEVTIGLDQTRLVFNNADGVVNEISRADVEADGTATTPIQITTGGIERKNPSLAGNGGTILYEDNQKVYKMNHDGSLISDVSSLAVQPNISSDGRWAVYVKDGTLEAMYLPTATSTPLETTITDAANPVFNPEMTQIVFQRTDAANQGIWMLRVTIDLTNNTITPATAAIQLTKEGANADDRYPSFSPDGRYIIFTSHRWDGKDAIYVMNAGKTGAAGSGVTRIVDAGLSTTSDNSFAVFGPVNTDSENYYVAYVNTDEEIQIATLSKAGMSTSGGVNPVVDLPNSTGLTVAGKFSWARLREKGSVYAERVLQSKAVPMEDVNYYIKVDVDEASVPKGYIVQEVLPGWTTTVPTDMTAITIDGTAANSAYVAYLTNTPAEGQNTLKLIFSEAIDAAPHKPVDHIIKIAATTAGTSGDTQNITGTVEYGTTIADTTGNNTVLLGNPYCPFDIYNAGGATRMDTDKGIIENLDLLYAIECWVGDVQLEGHKGLWPSDVANYDLIILDTIAIWAHVPTGVGTVAGEYCFDSIGVGAPEMYWKSGKWVE